MKSIDKYQYLRLWRWCKGTSCTGSTPKGGIGGGLIVTKKWRNVQLCELRWMRAMDPDILLRFLDDEGRHSSTVACWLVRMSYVSKASSIFFNFIQFNKSRNRTRGLAYIQISNWKCQQLIHMKIITEITVRLGRVKCRLRHNGGDLIINMKNYYENERFLCLSGYIFNLVYCEVDNYIR